MIHQLIKANLILSTWWMYALVALTLLGANSTKFPPIFMLLVITLAFIINQFYYDQKANTNHHFISLPISNKAIVQGRYISIILIAIMYVLVQWVLGFTGIEMHYAFSWKDVIAVTSLNLIIVAIAIPIFYLIPSFIVAFGTMILFMFFGLFLFLDALVSILGLDDIIIFNDLDPGLVLLVEKYIPFQPYIVLSLASIAIFYLSIMISVHVFSRRIH